MASVEKKIRTKQTHLGPGGYGCPCCAPAKSHRKTVNRAVKRGKLKMFARQEIEEQREQDCED